MWKKVKGYKGLREYIGKTVTTYQVLVRVGGGLICETFHSKPDAVRRLDELRGRRQTEHLQYKNISLGEYCKHWLGAKKTDGLRESSLTEYEYRVNVIKDYFGPSLKLKKISVPLVRAFQQQMVDKLNLSANRQGHIYSTLKEILDTAREDGYNVIVSPRRKRKNNNAKHEAVRHFEPEELDLLLKNAQGYGKVYRDIFDFMAHTGCRISETLPLTWGDINFHGRKIFINKARYKGRLGNPKTKHSHRTIPIFQPIFAMLQARKKGVTAFYLRYPRYRHLDLVFPSKNGDYKNPTSVSAILKRSLRKAGLSETLSLHNLRHTTATFLFSMTENILYVSKVLGHANAQITLKTYAHLLEKDDEEITQVINKSFLTLFNKKLETTADI